MPRLTKVLLSVALVAVLLVGGVVWYLGPIAPIATGYAAKIVCSGHFVAERSVEDMLGDLPDNPLVPFLRTSADDEAGTVTTTLLGAWGSTAYATEGLGCTLADEDPGFTALPPLPGPALDAPWPEGVLASPAPPGTDDEALIAAIDLAFTEDDPDGRLRSTRAVVVVKDGALIAERYAEGFSPDTPLLGWSMGKSLADAITGRLVAEGVLTADDTDLRPEWREDDRAAITVQDLLTMTDGLAFEEVYDPDTDATQMLFRSGSTADFAAEKPLLAPPGTRWEYSSGTTNLLCAAAHEASGLGPELARELVFAPLGMSSAVLEPDASGQLVCSSFPYATARDWARFGQWYLDDGVWDGQRLLPEGWVEESLRHIDVDAEEPYGRQWWLNEAPDGTLRMPTVPADAAWASGNEGQQVVVIPSEGLVVVRLGFSGEFSGVDWGLEPMLEGIIDALG